MEGSLFPGDGEMCGRIGPHPILQPPYRQGLSHQQQSLQVVQVGLLTGQDSRENPFSHLQAFLQVQLILQEKRTGKSDWGWWGGQHGCWRQPCLGRERSWLVSCWAPPSPPCPDQRVAHCIGRETQSLSVRSATHAVPGGSSGQAKGPVLVLVGWPLSTKVAAPTEPRRGRRVYGWHSKQEALSNTALAGGCAQGVSKTSSTPRLLTASCQLQLEPKPTLSKLLTWCLPHPGLLTAADI